MNRLLEFSASLVFTWGLTAWIFGWGRPIQRQLSLQIQLPLIAPCCWDVSSEHLSSEKPEEKVKRGHWILRSLSIIINNVSVLPHKVTEYFAWGQLVQYLFTMPTKIGVVHRPIRTLPRMLSRIQLSCLNHIINVKQKSRFLIVVVFVLTPW